ncbi:MAG: HAD family hydrolase [Rhizobiales bacterium]|nr:HAD family hydrolase [Hyphomicrobiales bacterium]
MPFDAAVFDFDGTLVDSAMAKRTAFFELFPASRAHRAIVEEVLAADPDGTRHRVVARMVALMQDKGLACDDATVLVPRYGDISAAAVAGAAELPGASAILAELAPLLRLHLCSNTPAETVRAHVAARGWSGHFRSVDGYPTAKSAKIAAVLASDAAAGSRLAVIGDGPSDEEAARANGCTFFAIRRPTDLMTAARALGARHV